MIELTVGLAKYLIFYTRERPLQSLGQKTLDVVYKTAMGRRCIYGHVPRRS